MYQYLYTPFVSEKYELFPFYSVSEKCELSNFKTHFSLMRKDSFSTNNTLKTLSFSLSLTLTFPIMH